MFNKHYLPFWGSLALFAVILIYSAGIVVSWNNEIETEENYFEVNLPIMDWQKYSNLSKQLDGDTVNDSS